MSRRSPLGDCSASKVSLPGQLCRCMISVETQLEPKSNTKTSCHDTVQVRLTRPVLRLFSVSRVRTVFEDPDRAYCEEGALSGVWPDIFGSREGQESTQNREKGRSASLPRSRDNSRRPLYNGLRRHCPDSQTLARDVVKFQDQNLNTGTLR